MKHRVILSMSDYGSGLLPVDSSKEVYEVTDGKCKASLGDLSFDIAINDNGTAAMEVETYNPCTCDSSFSRYTLKEGEPQSIFHCFNGNISTYSVKFEAVDE